MTAFLNPSFDWILSYTSRLKVIAVILQHEKY